MKVVIIKYNAGNVQSLEFALNRLGIDPLVTDDHEEIQQADKIIFPGQGEARSAMNYLKDKKLDRVLTQLRQPVLGICLGMQLMCSHTEENDTTCLGIMDAKVKRFEGSFKIPHMGWNELKVENVSNVFKDVINKNHAYFIHSYEFIPEDKKNISITTHYGKDVMAAVSSGNIYGSQFHPEKSQNTGIQILTNFLNL